MLLVFLNFGCAEVPLDVSRFDPAIDPSGDVKAVIVNDEVYAVCESPENKITAALFSYNTIFVLSIDIENRTGRDILPGEYSVSLADGRDLKPIRMLSRQDLILAKSKDSSGYGGGIQDQLIQATMDAVMNRMNVATKQKMYNMIDQGINGYFSFRPIFARDHRNGILCFLPDFVLEYPITLKVKIRGKGKDIIFVPRAP